MISRGDVGGSGSDSIRRLARLAASTLSEPFAHPSTPGAGAGRMAGATGHTTEFGDVSEDDRFRTLVENLPDPVARFDRMGRHLYVNPAGAAIAGRTRESLLGRTNAELGLPPNVLGRWNAALEEVFATGEERTVEFNFPTAAGVRWFQTRLVPEPNPAGTVDSVLGISRDVTKLKDAEFALRESEVAIRESEQRFRLVATATQDVIYDWDIDTGEVLWNDVLHDRFGYEPEGPVARVEWWTEAIHPCDRDRVTVSLHLIVTGGEEIWSEEYRFRRADGSYAIVLDRGWILRDPSGRAIRVIGSIVDLSEQKRIEAELSTAETHYRRLVETSPVAIFALDRRGRFIEGNAAASEILGRSAGEYLGRSFRDLLPADEHRLAIRTFRRLMNGEALHLEEEYRITRPSGERRLVRVHVTAIRADELIVGVHGVARDITDERLRERQLQRAERLASIGTLLSGVAHELNNPIHAIGNFAELMLLEPRNDADAEALEIMKREAERAAKVVANLRLMARQTLDGPGERVLVDINEVVEHVARLRRYTLQTQNVTLVLDLSRSMQPVHASRSELEQVVLNLVLNAEHAMRGTEVDQRLVLRTSMQSAMAVVEVIDTGPGIAPDTIDRIFDPFFTTKAPGEGTGLGLSLVHNIVADHGGRVDVRSNPGTGTCFRVELPVAAAGDGASPTDEPLTSLSPRRPLRILIVDDEEPIRLSLTRFLTMRGHGVAAAESGEEALRIIDDGRTFDVILSDLRMPGLGGEEIHARLEALGDPLAGRMLFMTGDAAGLQAAEVLRATGVPALLKPLRLEQLARAIEEFAA